MVRGQGASKTPGMTICDLSPFYCAKGGGIRTFHRARIAWFARQTRHRYLLISPGPFTRVSSPAPSITLLEIYGPRLTSDADRYRLLFNYRAVRAAIDEARPDVLEVHDPWLSPGFGLLLRRQGAFGGILASFWHSDPVATYIEPRLRRFLGDREASARLSSLARRGFQLVQQGFDVTWAASDGMLERLHRSGVKNVVKSGFGVDPPPLKVPRYGGQRATRLLYAGRLDEDKEFGLLLAILPDLLRRPGVLVTIIGAGAYAKRLNRMSHRRLRYLGFLEDPLAVRAAYARNDVLLAPGRYETFGLAALEACAAGLLVVGPDEGGTGEILRQIESPFVFRAGDGRMFLERVEMALEAPVHGVVERGCALAARLGTWSESVGRHVAMYESMLMTNDQGEAHRLLA
jgi:alpha-1,6-mannosyltransferase